jgi:hypothetical protein
MTRSQFPLKIYAGGYFTLSLDTFMAVCFHHDDKNAVTRTIEFSDFKIIVVLFCCIKFSAVQRNDITYECFEICRRKC